MRRCVWPVVVLLGLAVWARAMSPVAPTEAADVAGALIEEVGRYTRSAPEAPGAFSPWSGGVVRVGEALLVHRYPELEPSYYIVLVATDGRSASFVTVDASTGRWQAYGEIPIGVEFPGVSRVQAAELVRTELGRECAPDEFRAVSMPNKILYWYCADHETFVSLSDPSDIRVGLDAELAPWRSEPEPPPVPELDRAESGPPIVRYPPSYDIQGVPHYYQQTSYSCGPAALEMVFDYWGEHVNQTDIARAANCNSAIGTYARDLLRAAHFSGMSMSVQWPYFWGYAERSLGYAANDNWWSNAPDYPDRYNDLKTLVSSDYPIIILCWYDASHSSGHFRVVKGYDDNTSVFIVHDPWYSPPYYGPNVHFNQAFLVDDLWTQWYRWGMFTAPWDVVVTVPWAVPTGMEFPATAVVTHPGPHPFEGDYVAGSPAARIALSSGLSLAELETTVKPLAGIGATGSADTVLWQVFAKCGATRDETITVGSRGTITGGSPSYISYADSIGGSGEREFTVQAYNRVIYVDADGGGDETTIQDGINRTVCDGDRVVVLPGVYTGGMNRNLEFGGRNIVVTGQAGPDTATIDCQGLGRGFYFEGEDTNAVVSGFIVRNGWVPLKDRDPGEHDGGGILCNGASPKLTNLVIEGCMGLKGGGIAWTGGEAPVIEDVRIAGCWAYRGGGVYGEHTCVKTVAADARSSRQDFARLRNVQFLWNGARRGGGMYCTDSCDRLRDVTFRENVADSLGGGLYCKESLSVLERALFAGNRATTGAAAYFENDYGTGILHSTIAYNVAGSADSLEKGSAVEFNHSSGGVLNSIISHTAIGSAIACIGGGNPCIDHCDIYANAAGDTICGSCEERGRNENISYDPLYCDGGAYDFALHDDSRCLPAQNPWGEQIGRYGAGGCGLSGVADGGPPVTALGLLAPSPNPFGAAAVLDYEVPARDDHLVVTVYSLSGRVVKTFHEGPPPGGRGTLVWDGTDEEGNLVSSGVYFVRASFGVEEVSRKLVVLR